MTIDHMSNNVVKKLEQTVRYEKKQVKVLRVSKSSSNIHAYMIFPEFSEVKISNTELDEYIENLLISAKYVIERKLSQQEIEKQNHSFIMTCAIEEDGVIDDETIYFNTTYVKPPTIANKVFKLVCGLGNRLDSLKELHISVLNNNINRIEIEFYNENEEYVEMEKEEIANAIMGAYTKANIYYSAELRYVAVGNELKLKSIKPKLAGDI
ncbi:hypothetical protein J7E43_11360 [Bacillus sp. ISL-8]|uniref:hypothetical protein n=1 Tax=Bacillus mycoides TaxID=1405 RepID=UPI001BE7B31D|nr:hypothetical protein [Bacillus mycoides]MBT2578004.1 hypothetical protein [Bacillus sp. ISL-8]MEC5237767.1 hypothetical protein [Bacillus mycoides]MEC5241548.1 hypothetical protein [Bacillus mycoides]MEC5263869.1 hypothetical protein [Bacillus mycoides]